MIIEKLLPQELEDEVYKVMMATNFPWFWNAEQIVPDTPDDHVFQLTHVFLLHKQVYSKHYNLVNTIVGHLIDKTGLKVKRVVRIKGNLIPSIVHDSNSLTNMIHADIGPDREGKFVSMVYYVADSDGETVIFEEDKKTVVATSSPKKGNAIWFDSRVQHRSSVPIDNKRRVIINFILEIE